MLPAGARRAWLKSSTSRRSAPACRVAREVRDHLVGRLAASRDGARRDCQAVAVRQQRRRVGIGRYRRAGLGRRRPRRPTRWWISRSPAISRRSRTRRRAGIERKRRGRARRLATGPARRAAAGDPPARRGDAARLQRLPFAVRRAALAQANAFAPEALTRRLPALLDLLIHARRTPAVAKSATFRALSALALGASRGSAGRGG